MASAPVSRPARIELRFEVEEKPGRWLLDEENVPETPLHDRVIQLLLAVLQCWAHRSERDALVTSNLGCRWDPQDARVGIDPDVVLVEPAPPEGEALTTLRVWQPHHHAPRVAIEVASEATAAKDYLDGPARCARLGVNELWVFDPLRLGPGDTGGPHVLQVWRLDAEAKNMQRVYAGDGPAFSEELGAYVVVTDEGSRLRIADDEAASRLWPTEAEAEAQRAAAEAQRAAAEAQRAAAEAQRADEAEAELARLRALLAEKGG